MCSATNMHYLEDFFGNEKLDLFIENNYGNHLSSTTMEYLFVDYDDFDLLKLNKLIFSYKVIRGQLEEKFGYKKIKNYHFKTFCTNLMERAEPNDKYFCRTFIVGKINKYLKPLEEFYSNKLIEGNTKTKEKSKEYATSKITCQCGCEVTKSHLARHKQSPKHISFLENSKNII
jgi:hypothetical protein